MIMYIVVCEDKSDASLNAQRKQDAEKQQVLLISYKMYSLTGLVILQTCKDLR